MRKAVSILLAFILTGMLILFCTALLGRQVIQPGMNESGAQVSDDIIREEQQLIQKRITKLANLYSFRAEPVAELITEDTLRELNTQASAWWNSILKRGKAGEEVTWNTNELEQTLAANMLPSDTEDTESLAAAATDAVRSCVIRTVLPMRQSILEAALQKAGEKLDLPNLIAFFLGSCWAALALCAFLAGLIALAWSRQTFREALLYIGGALGAAALVMIAAALLCLNAGIQPMIREASESMAILFRKTASGTMILAGLLTAVMAAGSILCLAMSRKKGKTA